MFLYQMRPHLKKSRYFGLLGLYDCFVDVLCNDCQKGGGSRLFSWFLCPTLVAAQLCLRASNQQYVAKCIRHPHCIKYILQWIFQYWKESSSSIWFSIKIFLEWDKVALGLTDRDSIRDAQGMLSISCLCGHPVGMCSSNWLYPNCPTKHSSERCS